MNTDIKYGNISLNGKLVGSQSLEGFKKSRDRVVFEDHYKGTDEDKTDLNMELAWKKCVEAFPPAETPNADPAKVDIVDNKLVDFKVSQEYLDANTDCKAAVGDTIQIPMGEVKKYTRKK